MIDFHKYFEPLYSDIVTGYNSIIILITINELLLTNNDIYRCIGKEYPYFWVETINAHESNVFINLGKIFDRDARVQSIHFLKRWLIKNDSELKEERIKARSGQRRKIKWDDYRKNIHVFSRKDFLSYEKKVSSLYNEYDPKIKDWRNKIYAHREHYENDEIRLETVRYNYIEQIYAGLHGLYNDAFNAFYNGFRFSLEPRKLLNEEVIIQQTTEVLKSNFR
jgi:hypothetical protein